MVPPGFFTDFTEFDFNFRVGRMFMSQEWDETWQAAYSGPRQPFKEHAVSGRLATLVDLIFSTFQGCQTR